MKTPKFLFFNLLLILFAGITFTSCTNGDDNSPNTDLTNDDLTGDAWKVSYFWDKDKEETAHFNGYLFYFQDSGIFEAHRNGTVQTGSWQVRNSSDGGQRLDISITAIEPLEELIDDWIVLEKSASVIKLRDDNDEHLEELHFMKQ